MFFHILLNILGCLGHLALLADVPLPPFESPSPTKKLEASAPIIAVSWGQAQDLNNHTRLELGAGGISAVVST